MWVTADDAAAIAAAARIDNIDRDSLWETSKNVGYPILGLVRQISGALPEGPNGRVHYGATTQDIMDTGLALQLTRSLAALDRRLGELGDALAVQVEAHAGTVMPGRTHAQQAVPTTFGATLATLLGQFTRHRERLQQAVPRIAVISLFGAGGTSAALGAKSADVRTRVADLLDLHDTDIPWHVDRDGIAEYGWLCATVAATCAKLARNIVDLSRTEIGEVFEPYNSHRGASSTMPQKVNPISSEAIIGLSQTAGALLSTLSRIQEAGHERSAGEWQIEWQVIPQLGVLAGSALSEALVIVKGMRVDADRMRA
ncbi:MAG: 3-carboxy-cis,cis-muconate cycloisomerase, partial [Rhodococcus sp. (in: high G+C Gram-positive bacteria)]